MGIEDVVQNVKVNVEVNGVDEAADKVAGLQKQVDDFAEFANRARGTPGSGGRGGEGIEGLNDAFKNIGTSAAQAFSQILSSAATGNLTGLATLMGGPVAGGMAQAAESLGNFMKTQDEAIVRNAAMAREFGTTPQVMDGVTQAFNEVGVSGDAVARMVNRMSREIANDHAAMTKNIRMDSDTQESAALRVMKAREALQEVLRRSEGSLCGAGQIHRPARETDCRRRSG